MPTRAKAMGCMQEAEQLPIESPLKSSTHLCSSTHNDSTEQDMENEAKQQPVVEWWQSSAAKPELEGCASKLNEAQGTQDLVHRFSMYAQALNLLWSGKARLSNDRERSDSQGFRDILLSIPTSRQKELCDSLEIGALSNFVPQILNVKTLRESELYFPDEPIPPKLKTDASVEHRQLANAHKRWCDEPKEETRMQTLKKLGTLLYVVRSNIAHGEKTMHGPDSGKADRDRQVCEITLPVIHAVADVLLDHPTQKLIAYGTLRPSEPNHKVLEPLTDQKWMEIEVEGTMVDRGGGLKGFRWCDSRTRHKAMLLKSSQLASFWGTLDSFEGIAYRRTFATALVGEVTVVATIYQ